MFVKKVKRIINIVLCFAILFAANIMPIYALSEKVDNLNYFYTEVEGGICITEVEGIGNVDYYRFPADIANMKVVEIGNGYSNVCEGNRVKKVIIPNGIKRVNARALGNFLGIETLEIGSDVVFLGKASCGNPDYVMVYSENPLELEDNASPFESRPYIYFNNYMDNYDRISHSAWKNLGSIWDAEYYPGSLISSGSIAVVLGICAASIVGFGLIIIRKKKKS